MAQSTRLSIIEGTVKLAQTKQINRITVKNITDACGVTRNTFYYYFHDIYDVLNSFFEEKISSQRSKPGLSPQETIFEFIKESCKYKGLWYNLYKSMGHEVFTRYVTGKIHQFLMEEIKNYPNSDKISNLDLYLITGFYEEAFCGLLIRLVKDVRMSGSGNDMSDILNRMTALFDGQFNLMISNCFGTHSL